MCCVESLKGKEYGLSKNICSECHSMKVRSYGKIGSGERDFEGNESIGDVDDRGAYPWSIVKYYRNGRSRGAS